MIDNDKIKDMPVSNETLYAIGVDIGGTKTKICIADLEGNSILFKEIPTTSHIPTIYNEVIQCIHDVPLSLSKLVTVGFGVAGLTDSIQGIIIEAPALKWSNVSFKNEMEQLFKVPVFVNNDANCAAFAERWKGCVQGVQDFVFVAIGTGVGSAIFTNGQLVEGSTFMAGEIGYLRFDSELKENRPNRLDEFGEFESRLSGSALSQSGYDAEILFKMYRDGDAYAIEVIRKFIYDLSIGLANIASLLNPQIIVIGGGVARSMPIILDDLQECVSKLTPVPTTIKLSEVGHLAGSIGALAFALEQSGNPWRETNDKECFA